MESLEFLARNSFINLFLFMTSSVGLLWGTLYSNQHNRLKILYIRRMDDSVILYEKESDRKEVKVG